MPSLTEFRETLSKRCREFGRKTVVERHGQRVERQNSAPQNINCANPRAERSALLMAQSWHPSDPCRQQPANRAMDLPANQDALQSRTCQQRAARLAGL